MLDQSPLVFVGGLLLTYAALAILVAVVFKSRSVPLTRRRPDEAAVHTSNLTKLTDQAVHSLNQGLRSRGSGLLNREKLDSAGLKKQPGDYLLIAGAFTFVAVVLGFLLGGILFAVLMLLLAPVGLLLLLNVLVARRRKKFDEQVPDSLQMLAGGLRAGHSLLRSVDAAAEENEAPMKEELNRVVNETRIGRDLGESLAEVARRTDNEDFASITRAIEIHREVGGDLAQVLDNVGETIRDRNQLRGQVKALSAEGRMSAVVLMALPIVMFFGLTLFNPLYSKVFLTTFPGFLMIVAAVVLLAVGGFWLSRLIKPKF
ncbi:type II secretion system protein F [Arthrobacter sp. KBS0702]|uniref:type II secretion system F family protein n=1 Tax=Arthrobacter sp. KBS0702 TaxID=2578107 RepID=UPI00110E0E6A|nr:type II secretion system F family protein [Arthrobacter sp. KBS0702]QDW30523.1 type II secretion system protein F [Arthrobacter sp. KBS0702]